MYVAVPERPVLKWTTGRTGDRPVRSGDAAQLIQDHPEAEGKLDPPTRGTNVAIAVLESLLHMGNVGWGSSWRCRARAATAA